MKTLGQIGYEGYRNHTGGISLVSQQPIPAWEGLKKDIQDAWEAAAQAIASECIDG